MGEYREDKKLRCECGAAVVVVDDYGSIGCPDDCGWEGITIVPEIVVFIPESTIDV